MSVKILKNQEKKLVKRGLGGYSPSCVMSVLTDTWNFPEKFSSLVMSEKMSLIMQIIIKLKQKRLIKNKKNSRVPPFIPYPKVFKPSDVQNYILTIYFKFKIKISLSRLRDVQNYILTIYFKFEIKISLSRLREEPVVAFHHLL